MATRDGRCLSPEAQEAIRVRVVEALRRGMKPAVAARTFGVSRASVWNWRRRIAGKSIRALRSLPRGRPARPRLSQSHETQVTRMITDRCPNQLKLPFALWTRGAVRQMLAERFDVRVSERTAGRYLRQWGFTPQKPMRRAFERDPEAVKRWLKKEYPHISRRAKAEKAEIQWGDQMGLRSDHQTGRSYAPRGRTPVIEGTGKRFGCNMMSTITNRGRLSFMIFKEGFTAKVCIRFLRRLIKQSRRKIFLILDRHPVHRSRLVQQWIAAHAAQLALFFLPAYSPDLNPDELLNQDVKSNALGRRRPADSKEMIADVRRYLRSTQGHPDIVKRYFEEKHVRYAAA